jgi:hypothetical protein
MSGFSAHRVQHICIALQHISAGLCVCQSAVTVSCMALLRAGKHAPYMCVVCGGSEPTYEGAQSFDFGSGCWSIDELVIKHDWPHCEFLCTSLQYCCYGCCGKSSSDIAGCVSQATINHGVVLPASARGMADTLFKAANAASSPQGLIRHGQHGMYASTYW